MACNIYCTEQFRYSVGYSSPSEMIARLLVILVTSSNIFCGIARPRRPHLPPFPPMITVPLRLPLTDLPPLPPMPMIDYKGSDYNMITRPPPVPPNGVPPKHWPPRPVYGNDYGING